MAACLGCLAAMQQMLLRHVIFIQRCLMSYPTMPPSVLVIMVGSGSSAAISACGRCQQWLRTQWSRLCYWQHGNCKLRSLPEGFDAESLAKDSPLEVVVSPTSPVESLAPEFPPAANSLIGRAGHCFRNGGSLLSSSLRRARPPHADIDCTLCFGG